ncbi:MAG TPA: GTP 3',8-cyclase MoaA [Gemmatimonadales bacterium]|nr:GTP 3',8-cyclase MoaA [Gemmatimonadales bacterium]
MTLRDLHGRPLGALRISVTDRCNLRCRYCMPAASYRWLPRESLLGFEQIARAVSAFVDLGVTKVRITGGEPLLRPDLPHLVRMLAEIPGIDDLALTTNATRLAPLAAELRRAGLGRITISLDTLRQDRMTVLTRHARIADVMAGMDAARTAGFQGTKLNTVVIRGVNDDELADIVGLAAQHGIEPRFIEYMDVGGATDWRMEDVVTADEIIGRLADRWGGAVPLRRGGDPHAPAERWRLGDGTVVGVVASMSAPFCGDCDRSRLTADGFWYRCLYAREGTDLSGYLADDSDLEALRAAIVSGWSERADRGAEERQALPDRRILVPLTRLQDDPRLEMHVRGG